MKQLSESDRRSAGVRKSDTPAPETRGSARRIRYLASCHEADNRESAIFDPFHRDVKHRHFATGTEVLLSGIQDALAVPHEVGSKALEEAALYKRERSLLYGAFFLVGRIEIDGRPGRLAAPLIHFPASLERRIVGGELDLERYRMLRRAGLSVFPLSLASWSSDESSCLAAIERQLVALGSVT